MFGLGLLAVIALIPPGVQAGDVWVPAYQDAKGKTVPAHYLFRSHAKQYGGSASGRPVDSPLYYQVTYMSPKYKNNSRYVQSQLPRATLPEHARRDVTTQGWRCTLGYEQKDERCKKILIPGNAKLNAARTGWECLRGFHKARQACESVSKPKNAYWQRDGIRWQCKPGYSREDKDCQKIQVPPNARLDLLANDWYCNFGYVRSGGLCAKVELPANAHYNSFGTGWACNLGFSRLEQGCVLSRELPQPLDLAEIEWESSRN